MNLAVWAERDGVARVSAYRWFRVGLLPVPAQRVGRLIVVDDPSVAARSRSRRAVYARVSSADQKADLEAAVDGTVIEQVPNPRPLDTALRELRRVRRARSRCTKGSRRYRERTTGLSRLHRRVNDVRTHHLHVLTTRLAKTHGRIVVEGLDAAGMLRQKGLAGARARRRGLWDAALGTPRRHLSYKAGWYGSQLVVADRWFPSSKTCHACGHVQDIGWAEYWQCQHCWASHHRDDNAAINLARYEDTDSVVGPVGAAVKRGADRKTEPRSAGGCEARKGGNRRAAEQPRDGVRVA
jgi:putative transposase